MGPTALINILVTPSHLVTAVNVRVDAVTREERRADLPWMLCCPYA